MADYKQELAKLNSNQLEAVKQIDGPVLVIAGPGTGKTQLLSMRVANILEETDTDASSILCLTFTHKAATNMRERLNQLIGPESRHVATKTFHSFAADIMNQYPDYFWEGARLSVAPDAVIDDIIQLILSELPDDNPMASTFAGSYTALSDVKNGLKLVKEAGLTPDELRTAITENVDYINKIEPLMVDLLAPTLSASKLSALHESIAKLPPQKKYQKNVVLPLGELILQSLEHAINQDDDTGKTVNTGKWKKKWVQTVDGVKTMHSERKRNDWWLSLCDVYEQYRDYLHKRGFYDYSDMLIEVLEQLGTHPDMLADIQERYQYVLIDEFQDTNAAQLRLARLIADHHTSNNRPNLMAVGDDDQSIFAFNGAELNNMLEFMTNYPETKLIVLTDNYRSQQPILDFSKALIEQADDRLIKRSPGLNKDLSAKSDAKKSDTRHNIYPTKQHQYSELARTIGSLWKNGEKDIAVLARTHDSLRQLASILSDNDIPVRYEKRSNVLDHEAVNLIYQIASVAVAIGEGDKKAVNFGLSQLLRHTMWNLDSKILWKLATKNYGTHDWLQDLLEHDNEKLSSIGNWFTWLARNSDEMPLPLILEYILGLREGEYMLSPFRTYYLALSPVSSDYLETLSAIELLRGLVNEFSANNPTLSDFVRFVELNLSTKRVIADESWFVSGDDAVQLLTVYKAKGLEFEHVYVIDAIDDMWSPRSGGRKSPANLRLQSYGENYDDYVRLLYVASTRAKSMFTATSYATDSKGDELLPTPILSVVSPDIIQSELTESTVVLEEGLRWPRLKSKDEHALLTDRLENFELSPTALINFLNIAESGPKEFLERHILRLPTPGSVAGSFGTAIHASLETAQRLINEGHFELSTVVDRYESALIREHLISSDFERLMNRGEKLLTDILNDNLVGLERGGKTEQNIDGVIVENAHIKGKIDLINEDKSQILISDYKTGKPLASFDTKNKSLMTKAWRNKTQLLFYALLVRECGRYKQKDIKTQMIYVEADKQNQMHLTLNPTREELERLTKLINAVWNHVVRLDFPDVSKYSKDIDGIKDFENDLIKNTLA